MNISYNWLKRYIALNDSAEEVAKILTSIGLEVGKVEKVQTIKGGLEGLVVGEVITCVDHPNSDHLHITTTRVAPDAEPLQIVCGAPNVAAGQKVIVATVGTVLYDGDEKFTIKKGKIRGEESLGMICAEDEIGVGNNHDGIMVLPADTPVGMPAKEYFGVEDDTLIEVDITPNRSDAASHYGVARDLYAYYQAHGQSVSLTKPSVEAFAVNSKELPIEVVVENSDACPRYTGVSIKGVTIGESPEWLKNALGAIGIRSINNVVDVTNFVLHEMGQALHSFDADKIKGNKVIVKNATEGQKFITLDGIERTLSAADLMICNAEEPMCIAGVFGGQDSGITETTKNVFLESAYFNPVNIRKTVRRHQLSTDASFRYERGCDPNNTLYILKRCALLIQEVAGGEIAMEVTDIVGSEANSDCVFAPFPVTLNIDRIHSLIGKTLSEELIGTILDALEITIYSKDGNIWQIGVPRYRVDVQRECDVVEDILRIYGYNNVEFPEKLNTSLSYNPKPNPVALQIRISEQLTAQGFNEILNNSLTKAAYYDGNETFKSENLVNLMNPLSNDLNVMRQTLLFGGLESIAHNANRKSADLRFFEYGNCYYYNKERKDAEKVLACYSEDYHLGLWLTGKRVSGSWAHAEEDSSVYELKAYVENIFARLGLNMRSVVVGNLTDGIYSAALSYHTRGGKLLATVGIVSKKITKAFDIDNEVYYADINWKNLLQAIKSVKVSYTELSKFPSVKRDLALLLDKNVQFADIERIAYECERKLLKAVELFDVYEGKNLEPGKKSYAVSFILQDEEKTLNDKQIDKIMSKLIASYEKQLGAKLR
mgnify:CR=1 FL=1